MAHEIMISLNSIMKTDTVLILHQVPLLHQNPVHPLPVLHQILIAMTSTRMKALMNTRMLIGMDIMAIPVLVMRMMTITGTLTGMATMMPAVNL